ncbi:F0F1 ATP synthase subunit delta [Clostridium oryzae]|uniref:ATP synthase subunit delta n=1 Tax=Clostridium oryzae TaxID=1450648 RepID=A0A1V4IU15_9CLOT|nr:F0F1 ATP synthase subunit delta [Clostridium oryzae]OPJ63426.1 ATP synthase subunit delta, sodium ion specific [Clostridium oryzae]
MYEYLDRRYALALYKIAEEKNKVDDYLQQLRVIVDAIYSNEDMIKFLRHPEISISKKKEAFASIFKGKIEDDILQFLYILIDKDRILYLKEKLNEMEKIHLEKNNTLLALVKTAIPMSDNEISKLVEQLEKKYNKKVIVKTEIDESVIGGVYVRVGDDVIDGTIRSKLEDMRQLMLKAGQR